MENRSDIKGRKNRRKGKTLTHIYIYIKERENKIILHILCLSVNKIVREEKRNLIIKASFFERTS